MNAQASFGFSFGTGPGYFGGPSFYAYSGYPYYRPYYRPYYNYGYRAPAYYYGRPYYGYGSYYRPYYYRRY